MDGGALDELFSQGRKDPEEGGHGEFFLLPLPFIERGYQTCEFLARQISADAINQDLSHIGRPTMPGDSLSSPVL